MGVCKVYRDDRPAGFGVRWMVDGKRKFKFFQYKIARDEFYRGMILKEKELGNVLLDISSEEAGTIKQCMQIVGNCPDIIVACKEFAERDKIVSVEVLMAQNEYLAEKKAIGRDENYFRAIRNMLDRGRAVLPKELTEWNDELCHRWIFTLMKEFAPFTVKNHIRTFKAFCNWCIRKKYLQENYFINCPVPEVVAEEIKFLRVENVWKLFETAKEHFPKAMAYLALNTFAGLRSSACARLDVCDIDFVNQGITIQAQNAKNKRRVYLDGYEDNLWKWLEWSKENAPEGFELTKRQWDEIRKDTAVKAQVKMYHNVLRHSFCTYHVALHGDAGKTATLLTHRGNVTILYEHYKGNVSKKKGKEFFGI